MFQKLVNHNDDLERLVEKGYAVSFVNNYLVVRDIPYLDRLKELQVGAFVTKLEFINTEKVAQENHQVFFAGSIPYTIDGLPIPNLAPIPSSLSLGSDCADIVVQFALSNKPKKNGRFLDFFEKIESYCAIISGPAMNIFDISPFTCRTSSDDAFNSVFKFNDTMTSRAEITDLSEMFEDEVIAIIGAGGTGSYILDLLVKTPVKKIKIFDLDNFHVHNAFRAPGAVKKSEFRKPKAKVYAARYKNFRKGVSFKAKFIDETSSKDLAGVTFAFVCVDKGASRASIFDLLLKLDIPFIDVGMGLKRKNGPLTGMMRATYYSSENGQQVRDKKYAEEKDAPDNIYKTNIQIAELNALNACLAVIKYKQLKGFYCSETPIHSLLFDISDLKIVGESELDEV